MEASDIKKKIKLAQEAVSDLDEPYKLETYKIILAKSLKFSASLKHEIDDEIVIPKGMKGIDTKKNELAKFCGVTVNELNDILFIDEKSIYLIIQLSGTESKKQVIASQCILLANEMIFEQEWLKSIELSKWLDKSGIASLSHVAKHLRKESIIFRITGSGKAAQYKITGPGKTSASKIISELIKGEIK